MNAVFRFITDTLTLAALLFVALIVVTLYTGDYDLIVAIHCKAKYASEIGEQACMLVNNN